MGRYKKNQNTCTFSLLCVLLWFFCAPSISFATKRLAVLEFEGVGVDENIVGLLADDVRIGVLEGIANRLVDDQEILVMTRENMTEMMKEMDMDPMECFGVCEIFDWFGVRGVPGVLSVLGVFRILSVFRILGVTCLETRALWVRSSTLYWSHSESLGVTS